MLKKCPLATTRQNFKRVYGRLNDVKAMLEALAPPTVTAPAAEQQQPRVAPAVADRRNNESSDNSDQARFVAFLKKVLALP